MATPRARRGSAVGDLSELLDGGQIEVVGRPIQD
jgi:hypothetical protein